MPAKAVFIYVPANFDPAAVLPPDLAEYSDCAKYFLHRIIWGRMQRNVAHDNYVPLKWDYLRQDIPDRVLRRLKAALISGEVIDCDDHYIEGKKAYCYRLRPPYSDAPIIRTAIQHGRTAERIKRNRATEQQKIRLDVHKYLRSQLHRLEIDLPQALELLHGHPHEEIVKIPVLQIAAKEITCSVCRYGRFHSDLTRCAKVVRRALHVAGQPLVCLDIKNSQPLFLALVVISYRRVGKKALCLHNTFDLKKPYEGIDDILSSIIKPFPLNTETNTATSTAPSITARIEPDSSSQIRVQEGLTTSESNLDNGLVNRDYLSVDERCFLRLCEEGRLYEELMLAMETPVRAWIKTGMFEVLYGKNGAASPIKNRFNELFPGIAQVVRELKRKDHTFLSKLMQKVESGFVVNIVCRRLMTEIPEAPVFTIHDSILTTAAYADEVLCTFREAFCWLGLSPRFHVTDYGASGSTDTPTE